MHLEGGAGSRRGSVAVDGQVSVKGGARVVAGERRQGRRTVARSVPTGTQKVLFPCAAVASRAAGARCSAEGALGIAGSGC